VKISIITACYNNAETIRDTLNSVSQQTYADIEYIIIDGASADGTLEILKSYNNSISKLVSEPDNGIYDALNKGLALASGDVVGFLHADDVYTNSDVLADVAACFKTSETDTLYGDLVYVSKDDTSKIVRLWESGVFNFSELKKGWMPPHPTFFVKRNIYEGLGNFDTSFRIAADYDLVLRFLFSHKVSTHYLPKVLIKMRTGGASNKSLSNILKKSKEDLRALRKNNVGGLGVLIFKNIRKIPQFFRRKRQ